MWVRIHIIKHSLIIHCRAISQAVGEKKYMAKPKTLTVGSKDSKRIVSLYQGNAKNPPLGARSVADYLGVSRRQVMAVLENSGVARFSKGSYA